MERRAAGPAGDMLVAEGAVSALHAEMVLYFVRAHMQREKLQLAQQVDVFGSGADASSGGGNEHGGAPGAGSGGGSAAGDANSCAVYSDVAELCPPPPHSIIHSLECMGFNAGARMIEVQLMSERRLLHMTPTDAMKFIAGPFWKAIFGRKVDRLKGSHHSFNMWDMNFKWTRANTFARRLFTENGSVARAVETAPSASAAAAAAAAPSSSSTENASHDLAIGAPKDYLFFISGAIRGALDALGFSRPQVSNVPPNPNTPAQIEFRIVFARDR